MKKNEIRLEIRIPHALSDLIRRRADESGISMAALIRRAVEREGGGQQVDLRDIGLLLDASKTMDEFKDLLNNTIATGKINWDDPLPAPSMAASARAAYIRRQVARRLAKIRGGKRLA